MPKGAFKNFTSDRGKTFACHEKVENRLGIDFYFADASYSAWQRGFNRNNHRLLREFFPKKTDLAQIKTQDLIDAIYKINSISKKSLAFNTPFDSFIEELNLLSKVSQ